MTLFKQSMLPTNLRKVEKCWNFLVEPMQLTQLIHNALRLHPKLTPWDPLTDRWSVQGV